jgi:hypothetical protein
MIGASARALVHAHNVHPSSQAFFGNAQHVIRFRGTFQPVDYDYRERRTTIGLPMTVAKHVNARLDFDQPFLGFRQRNSSRQKKTGYGLHVSAAEEFSRAKVSLPPERAGSCCLHQPILNAHRTTAWLQGFRSNPESMKQGCRLSTDSDLRIEFYRHST